LLKVNKVLNIVLLPTALVGKVKQSAASVRPFVRLSVHLFPLYLLNRLTFELEFLRVWIMTVARLGLKVKII